MKRETLLEFNRGIIEEFRANGGKCGGVFEDNPMLLLTMTGARTGRQLTTPLTYHADGDRLVVMASAGGSPTHPAWYHNLIANDRVVIEVGSERFDAIATEAVDDERTRLFRSMVTELPRFGEYQQKVKRTIPIMVLSKCT